MTQFLSLLVNGISLGAVYALIALGFVIISLGRSEITVATRAPFPGNGHDSAVFGPHFYGGGSILCRF